MFRAYQDNVVIAMEPVEDRLKDGTVVLVNAEASRRGTRTARVLASGPGYRNRGGHFVENSVKVGDRVLVNALAGQNYALDLSVPRHNKSSEFQALMGDKGEFRICREEEILGVLDNSEEGI